MSDSDESDEERMNNLREAVDTSFLDSKLFGDTSENSETKKETKIPAPKSQRYFDIDEEHHATDLQVPQSMQNFVARKLSEIIENKYSFVDETQLQLDYPKYKKTSSKNRVKLLRDFDVPIVDIDGSSDSIGPQKRPKIHRRQVEADDLSESEKVHASTIDADCILSGTEVSAWAEKPSKDKLFRYKTTKDGKLQFVEPENEFTKRRKKNCWSEKRIVDGFGSTKQALIDHNMQRPCCVLLSKNIK